MGQMHTLRALRHKELGKVEAIRAIITTDVSTDRLAAVRQRFAERMRKAGVELVTLDPTSSDFADRMRAVAPDGVPYVIACAPSPEVVKASIPFMRRYGVLNLFAGIKRGTGPIFLGDIHYDQITITGNSGSRLEDMEKMLRITERNELDTDFSAGAVVGMKACDEGVKAVAEGRITNKTILYPQLAELPLTRVEELASSVPFSSEIAAQVRNGQWSRQAEKEMLEFLLPRAGKL
jgi:threonine dehydrogenase-like Zn-dependent dehydrogenase